MPPKRNGARHHRSAAENAECHDAIDDHPSQDNCCTSIQCWIWMNRCSITLTARGAQIGLSIFIASRISDLVILLNLVANRNQNFSNRPRHRGCNIFTHENRFPSSRHHFAVTPAIAHKDGIPVLSQALNSGFCTTQPFSIRSSASAAPSPPATGSDSAASCDAVGRSTADSGKLHLQRPPCNRGSFRSGSPHRRIPSSRSRSAATSYAFTSRLA